MSSIVSEGDNDDQGILALNLTHAVQPFMDIGKVIHREVPSLLMGPHLTDAQQKWVI